MARQRLGEPWVNTYIATLRAVRSGLLREGEKQGKETTGLWLRQVRSAVSSTLGLWIEHGQRVGEHPLVCAYIDAVLEASQGFHYVSVPLRCMLAAF